MTPGGVSPEWALAISRAIPKPWATGVDDKYEPDLSLIVCSRNRAHQLNRCLEAISHIVCGRNWELIVVDNGSQDETATVIRQFASNTSIEVASIFEPRRGKSNGLNAALDIARGQILAFTDDDCYPADDFLIRIWEAFADPALGYLAGRITLHDPTDYPMTINESLEPLTFPGRSYRHLWPVAGASMAFRRQVLHDIGGFDPLLGPGSLLDCGAEDKDVAARASAIGWKGHYDPAVVVRHHHGRKAWDRAEMRHLHTSYCMGAGALYAKLLLEGHEFGWVTWIMYHHYLRRGWWFRSGFLWEMVGFAKYTYCFVTRRVPRRTRRPRS